MTCRCSDACTTTGSRTVRRQIEEASISRTLHPKIAAQLRLAGIRHTLHDHAALAADIRSPGDFARALGVEIARITKSLFLVDTTGKHVLAVCAVDRKLRTPLLAAALGVRRLEVAPLATLHEATGYPPGGVSPFGVNCTVCLDRALLAFDTIFVGAGAPGLELEVAPAELVAAVSASVEDMT